MTRCSTQCAKMRAAVQAVHLHLTGTTWQVQVLGELLVPPEMPAVQHFIELAALEPQRLGFDPSEASTYRTLPTALRVT